MRILLCGAQGFIGRHISASLRASGHELIQGVRKTSAMSSTTELGIDFNHDTDVHLWQTRLQTLNIDIVINAVGILSETWDQRYDTVHQQTPIALFEAADRLALRGIVHISALGADDANNAVTHANLNSTPQQLTAYLQSKRKADAYLSTLSCPHLIVRPSLIVGDDGASSQFFRVLASLPIIALPANGEQALQPVHIDDICLAISNWITQLEQSNTPPRHTLLRAVGPQQMSYRTMLAHYRHAMALGAAYWISIPLWCMRLTARIATYLPQKVFTPDTLIMLEQGNTADVSQFAKALHQTPKSAENWFAQNQGQQLASTAISVWENRLFRWVLALLWLASGIIPLFFYPHENSFALLAPFGLHGGAAMLTLIAASGADILLGIASIFYPCRRLWAAQIGLVLLYSALISFFLPEFLFHPFAPVLKNLPVLAILFSLLARDTK